MGRDSGWSRAPWDVFFLPKVVVLSTPWTISLSTCRSLGQATRFGAFLDPVADKLIVVTTMVLLAAAPPGPLEGVGVPAWALPAAALVIACRELLVSAVRVEGGWSGSGCSIVAGAGGLVGAPRQGSPNGSLHTRASAHLLSQGGTFGTSWASG